MNGPLANPSHTTGGRVLVTVYALFALAAGARSVVQLTTQYHVAPLAYWLSFLSAVVYLVATVALRRFTADWHRIALAAVTTELVGVVVIGTLSIARSDLFPDASVWSDYGQGYGYVPLVLPVIGLLWLRRHPYPPAPHVAG